MDSKSVVHFDVPAEAFRQLVHELAPKRVLTVCHRRSVELSGAAALLAGISDLRCSNFSHYRSNPTLAEVRLGMDLARAIQPDLIIAVGGGSAIDVAKMLTVCGPSGECGMDDVLRCGSVPYTASKPLFIAVPTTAGTGSEATHFATLYHAGRKHSICSAQMIPDHVILNAQMLASVPPYVAACTGLDALAHGIESYWSVSSTEESSRHSREAIMRLLRCLPEVIQNGSAETRRELLLAAHHAGQAINVTKTTAPHAISYPITARLGLPHGHAVFLTLPWFLEFNYHVSSTDNADARGPGFVRERMRNLFQMFGCETAPAAREAATAFAASLGVSLFNPPGFGGGAAIVEDLATMHDRSRAKNNPRVCTAAEVAGILASLTRA